MCPDNLFNSKLIDVVTGVVTWVGDPNNLPQVPSPTIPSAVKPFLDCQDLTADSVPGPNAPSAFRPNFSWSFLTSSPFDPRREDPEI